MYMALQDDSFAMVRSLVCLGAKNGEMMAFNSTLKVTQRAKRYYSHN